MKRKSENVGSNLISIELIFSILIILGIVSIIMYVSVAIKSDTKKINKTTEATIMLTSILENIGSRDYDNFTNYIENLSIIGLTKTIENDNQHITVIGGSSEEKILGVNIPEGYELLLIIEELNEEFDIIKKIDISITYEVNGNYEDVNMSTVLQKAMIGECNEPRFTSEYFSELGIDIENNEIIPIKYSKDLNSYVVTTSADSEWYNYSSKDWARVLVFPKRTSINLKDLYVQPTGNVNTTDESIDNYMYVWIPNFTVKNDQSYFRYGAGKNIIKMDFSYIDGKYLYFNTVGEEIEDVSKDCSFSGVYGVWRNVNSEDAYMNAFSNTKYGPFNNY